MTETKVLTIVVLFSLMLVSCSTRGESYEDHFNLDRYEKREYDLFNPILRLFSLDSLEALRKGNIEYFKYDAYYEGDTLRYFFERVESYGYLNKLSYRRNGKVGWIIAHPVLAGKLHRVPEDIRTIHFFYRKDSLFAIRDELRGYILFIEGDSAVVHRGILGHQEELTSRRVSIKNFYPPL